MSETVVPRRREMMATLLALAPFAVNEAFRVVEVGCGDGRFATALLECFPEARIVAFEDSEARRNEAVRRTTRFGQRARVRAFDLASLEWWDFVHGADLVVSLLSVHRLNDAKKQYLYKAMGERVSERGALLVADVVQPAHPSLERLAGDVRRAQLDSPSDTAGEPAALFHQLVWLKHAGFAAVDCAWMLGGYAVFGGFKSSSALGSVGLEYQRALKAVDLSLQAD